MLALLLAATLALPADAEETVAAFVVRDSATHDGRGVLHFRTLEFAKTPVRPTTTAVQLGAGVLHGLLPVGSGPDAALILVWNPKAFGGPELWVDSDGDGKLMAEECHVLVNKEIEVPVNLTVGLGEGVHTLRRMVLFRRSAVGEGLSYAVRGYAAGTLNLGGKDYAALLTDGNADGCFDSAGSDRIWIDLNRDGHFDGLTEQFLLGSPISVDDRIYVVRSNATASEVRVHPRSTARGNVRLTLTGMKLPPVTDLAVQLISDLGELVPIRDLNQPVALPVGRYRVHSVLFRLTDRTGVGWSYHFVGGHRYSIGIDAGKESAATILSELALELSVTPAGGVVPGRSVAVTPHLRTPSGLYLADCHMVAKETFQPMACHANIQLNSPSGDSVDRAASGFA